MTKSEILARLRGPDGHVPSLFEEQIATLITYQGYMISKLMQAVERLMEWEKAVGCEDKALHAQINRLLDDVEKELKQ